MGFGTDEKNFYPEQCTDNNTDSSGISSAY